MIRYDWVLTEATAWRVVRAEAYPTKALAAAELARRRQSPWFDHNHTLTVDKRRVQFQASVWEGLELEEGN